MRFALLGVLLFCACAPAVAADPPSHLVALMTDYGTEDFYVGALKGAILKVCPQAELVDLSHDVPAYDIRLGAFQLLDMAREFPNGTVFVAIVDPGVGTHRRPVLLETGNGDRFVGPDNGLFTAVEKEFGPASWREITNPKWMRPGRLSTTFHGRDIFGPAAGRLACGEPAEQAGRVISDPVRLDLPAAQREGHRIRGLILFCDHYGNLQTNIMRDQIEAAGIAVGDTIEILLRSRSTRVPLALTYGDVPAGKFVAVIASTDRLEVAINQGDASSALGGKAGDEIWATQTFRVDRVPAVR